MLKLLQQMPILKSINRSGKLAAIMAYTDKDNTDLELGRGVNCSCYKDIAFKEMQTVKEIYGKTGGREYKHYILSFATNEFSKSNPKDIEKALDYGEAFAKKCFGDAFQVYLAAHVGSEGVQSKSEGGCLHIHLVVNSVSFLDGHKYQSKSLESYKACNDALAVQYGFTPLDRSQAAIQKRNRIQLYSKDEYNLIKKSFQNKSPVLKHEAYNTLKEALAKNPKSFAELQANLSLKGWSLTVRGRNLVLSNTKDVTGKKMSFRLNTLARNFNDHSIDSAAVMKACNNPDWQRFSKSSSYKQQCAVAIVEALNKHPQSFKAFQKLMEEQGWNAVRSHQSIKFIKLQATRKSGKRIAYNANRLAADFHNPQISAMMIMQNCNEQCYGCYKPRYSKNNAMNQSILEQSAKLMQQLNQPNTKANQNEKNNQGAFKPTVNFHMEDNRQSPDYDLGI